MKPIRDSCRRLERPSVIEMAYKGGSTNFDMQLDRIAEYKPDVLFHWGNGDDAARVLNAIRARGWKQPFLTCDRAVTDEFLTIARGRIVYNSEPERVRLEQVRHLDL